MAVPIGTDTWKCSSSMIEMFAMIGMQNPQGTQKQSISKAILFYACVFQTDIVRHNLEKKTNTHGMRLAQPKSKFKPREKQNPKSHQGFGRGSGRGTGRGTKVIGFDTLPRHAPWEQRRRERRKKKQREGERERERERERWERRETERQRDRETERQRDREVREERKGERWGRRETERQRDRETEKWEKWEKWEKRGKEREREREREERREKRDRETEKGLAHRNETTTCCQVKYERPKWPFFPNMDRIPMVIPPCVLDKICTGKKQAPQNPKHISESNKNLCANALRRKNKALWICEEWSVLSTCEWHTGMRQLDAPRHNLGQSPSKFHIIRVMLHN